MHLPESGEQLLQRRIGEILISEGKITKEQLEEALEVQKTGGRKIGRILVSLGT